MLLRLTSASATKAGSDFSGSTRAGSDFSRCYSNGSSEVQLGHTLDVQQQLLWENVAGRSRQCQGYFAHNRKLCDSRCPDGPGLLDGPPCAGAALGTGVRVDCRRPSGGATATHPSRHCPQPGRRAPHLAPHEPLATGARVPDPALVAALPGRRRHHADGRAAHRRLPGRRTPIQWPPYATSDTSLNHSSKTMRSQFDPDIHLKDTFPIDAQLQG